jgi:hypothetical protein
MNIGSKTRQRGVAGLTIACVIVGITVVAFALPANQVLRVESNQTFAGGCCFSWGDTVTVTEPAKLSPVVVTWSADYQANNNLKAGIAVNGHPCQFSGGYYIDASVGFRARTFQWVVLPSDGLVKGNNTLTVCGGGISNADVITLGFRTLAVTSSQ